MRADLGDGGQAEAEFAFQFLLGDMAMAIQILGHGTAVVRFHCGRWHCPHVYPFVR